MGKNRNNSRNESSETRENRYPRKKINSIYYKSRERQQVMTQWAVCRISVLDDAISWHYDESVLGMSSPLSLIYISSFSTYSLKQVSSFVSVAFALCSWSFSSVRLLFSCMRLFVGCLRIVVGYLLSNGQTSLQFKRPSRYYRKGCSTILITRICTIFSRRRIDFTSGWLRKISPQPSIRFSRMNTLRQAIFVRKTARKHFTE